jgi:hypothetical protein
MKRGYEREWHIGICGEWASNEDIDRRSVGTCSDPVQFTVKLSYCFRPLCGIGKCVAANPCVLPILAGMDRVCKLVLSMLVPIPAINVLASGMVDPDTMFQCRNCCLLSFPISLHPLAINECLSVLIDRVLAEPACLLDHLTDSLLRLQSISSYFSWN